MGRKRRGRGSSRVRNDALGQWHLKLLTSIRFIAWPGMVWPWQWAIFRARAACNVCSLNVAHCGILRIRCICRVALIRRAKSNAASKRARVQGASLHSSSPTPSPASVRHMSMHIYELALSTLLMGFDTDADARFVFPRLASVLTVQEGDKQQVPVGGDNKQQRKEQQEQ